ncbi:MAG: class I SAM-dependent methyltransferase [Lachnospiraceae bacterium]|nr:class I SAM-dependent methyltransferase [Lachnospiraceae bacterium]
MTSDLTIDYYEKNANSFVNGTLDVDFTDIQDRFLAHIPEGGLILDFGCGSGRDTKCFIGKGFKVDAIDGSENLCKIASENTGIPVKHYKIVSVNDTIIISRKICKLVG